MTLPVIETIAVEMVTRLEAITLTNGYSFDVTSVDRPNKRMLSQTPRDKTIWIVQAPSRRNEDLDHPGNPPAIAYEVEFHLHCFLRESDHATTATATAMNSIISDVHKAITNADQWYHWSGNAVDTHIGDPVPFISAEGDHQGATLPIIVTYRISENDPYTARA